MVVLGADDQQLAADALQAVGRADDGGGAHLAVGRQAEPTDDAGEQYEDEHRKPVLERPSGGAVPVS